LLAARLRQIPYHLNRAMDNGLTQSQAAEVITHLAFNVGWPNAFSVLPVVKEVFEKQPSRMLGSVLDWIDEWEMDKYGYQTKWLASVERTLV
jgi:hypothetical protein